MSSVLWGHAGLRSEAEEWLVRSGRAWVAMRSDTEGTSAFGSAPSGGFPGRRQGAGLLRAARRGCPGFLLGSTGHGPLVPCTSPAWASSLSPPLGASSDLLFLTWRIGTRPGASPGPLSVPHVLPVPSVLHTAQGSSEQQPRPCCLPSLPPPPTVPANIPLIISLPHKCHCPCPASVCVSKERKSTTWVQQLLAC